MDHQGFHCSGKKFEINSAAGATITATKMARRGKIEVYRPHRAEGGNVKVETGVFGCSLSNDTGSSFHFCAQAADPSTSAKGTMKLERLPSNCFSSVPLIVAEHPLQVLPRTACPFRVSEDEINRVEQLLALNSNFWKKSSNTIISLQRKRQLNQEKLLGLKFSMHDKNAVFSEQSKELDGT